LPIFIDRNALMAPVPTRAPLPICIDHDESRVRATRAPRG
jgi:hypothetical protein